MVTIKMIAKECGFSIATVSKALNGAPDISAETKETIRKVASQMGYTPNSAARMLKTSRSYNFGVLFEDQANKGLTHSFFSHILNSFKHRAEELGYDISFISDHMGGQEISYVDHACYRNCDGVVIASVDYTEHAVVDLANSGIPVVTIDCVFENCGSVLSDNVGGMTELVKYARRYAGDAPQNLRLLQSLQGTGAFLAGRIFGSEHVSGSGILGGGNPEADGASRSANVHPLSRRHRPPWGQKRA